MSNPYDRAVAANAIRVTRGIVAQQAVAKDEPEEFKLGTKYQTEEALIQAAANIGTTILHSAGTVRMVAAADALAVLDHRHRVRDVDGFRVTDALFMPTIASGNTNSPTLLPSEGRRW